MAGAAGGGGPGGSKQNSAYNCGNPNGNGNVAKTNVVLWSWFGFEVAEYNECDVWIINIDFFNFLSNVLFDLINSLVSLPLI